MDRLEISVDDMLFVLSRLRKMAREHCDGWCDESEACTADCRANHIAVDVLENAKWERAK